MNFNNIVDEFINTQSTIMDVNRYQSSENAEHYINTLLDLEMSINNLNLTSRISNYNNYTNGNIYSIDIESIIDSIQSFTDSLQESTNNLRNILNTNNSEMTTDNSEMTTYNNNDYGYVDLIRNISIYDKNYFKIIKHNEKTECDICYSKKKLFTELNNCKHSFCNLCVKIWIKTNNTCPMCRTCIMPLNVNTNITSTTGSSNNVDNNLDNTSSTIINSLTDNNI